MLEIIKIIVAGMYIFTLIFMIYISPLMIVGGSIFMLLEIRNPKGKNFKAMKKFTLWWIVILLIAMTIAFLHVRIFK